MIDFPYAESMRATYAYNWLDIPVPFANSFWQGWVQGAAKLPHPVPYTFNGQGYDMGYALGHEGVNARDAMGRLIMFCNQRADARARHEDNS